MIALILAALIAQPGQLPAVIAKARPGDSISVRAGDHGLVKIVGRTFSPRLTLKMNPAARMNLLVQRSSGLTLRGGRYGPAKGSGPAGYAVSLIKAADVTFQDGAVADSARGIVMSQSVGVVVARMAFTGISIDGINIASSQRVTIADNVFRDFVDGPSHPDAIQGWSRPATGITADVVIRGNRITGPGMQGIFFGNHVRAGVDDGGFDRVTITGNSVAGNYPQGIHLNACRACVAEDNTITTLPGARHRASMNVVNSTGDFSRNLVAARP